MRDFLCPRCNQRLAFENSMCLACRSTLGLNPDTRAFQVIDPADGSTLSGSERMAGRMAATRQRFRAGSGTAGSGTAASGKQSPTVDGDLSSGVGTLTPATEGPLTPATEGEVRACVNLYLAGCNWLVTDNRRSGLCLSCRLTRVRPPAGDLSMPAFLAAESAKRRLIFELLELGLPIVGRTVDATGGLAFDLLSSASRRVVTGHASGLITLDLAEGDTVHRERQRVAMDEPYRTLLGHLRHEIGHYYFGVLVGKGPSPQRAVFERLYGDPGRSYRSALKRHYAEGAPADWSESHVSAYATMHPAEDWAETFAHYLHIRDTVDTACAFGMAPSGVTLSSGSQLAGDLGLDRLIEVWLPLSWSLNMINRSMGHPDLYPFVLPVGTVEKMRLVHSLVVGATA